MDIFRKIKGTNAQHTIEYAILLTLIMAGIIIAGPYVIRSWNANLKGWEDSVQDSLQDQHLEVPAGSIPITGCDPDPAWVDQGCNLGINDYCTATMVNCGEQEMLSTLSYSPPGCQCAIPPTPPSWIACTVHPCCCTPPVPTGRCGVNVTFVTGLTVPDNAACPGPPPYTKNMIDKNGDGTCPDGMMEAWSACGNDDPTNPAHRRYGCIPDATCIFSCTGSPSSGVGYLGLCAGDAVGLPSDVPYTYTDVCSAAKCEILCDNSVHHYSM